MEASNQSKGNRISRSGEKGIFAIPETRNIPYPPNWELYFEQRLVAKMANTLQGRGTARYLWLGQDGKCLVCGQALTLELGWHVHHWLWRVHGGTDTVDNLVLLHPNCHRQVHREGLAVDKAVSREGHL